MIDETVDIAGLRLPNPVLVGAGPNTKDAKRCIAALKAGAGAVEYRGPSREGPPHRATVDQHRIIPTKQDAYRNRYFGYASTGFQRFWPESERSLEVRLRDIQQTKAETAGLGALVVNIGSVDYRRTGVSPEEKLTWGELARHSQEAGADALMLHLQTGQSMAGAKLTENPDFLRNVIKEVKNVATVPVIAKLPIEGCDPIAIARFAFDAGADAIAPTGRYIALNIDLESESVPEWKTFHGIGGPWALPIMAAWTALMRRAGLKGPIIPGGGVMGWEDIARLILAGASAVQACTWPILKGYEVLEPARRRMRAWMQKKGYGSLADFRGNTVKAVEGAQRGWARYFEKGPYEGLRVNPEVCNGCRACLHPCFYDAIAIGPDRKAHIEAANCVGCGNCYQVCPVDAIVLSAVVS